MSIYKLFGTDQNLERNGIVLEYGEATFTVARAGGANKKFQSCVERKMRPYRSAINAGTMDQKVAERLLAEAYAEAVILDWEGVTYPPGDEQEGQPMPFTKENCVRVLLIPGMGDLFLDIQEQSMKVANFISAEAEEDAKT